MKVFKYKAVIFGPWDPELPWDELGSPLAGAYNAREGSTDDTSVLMSFHRHLLLDIIYDISTLSSGTSW